MPTFTRNIREQSSRLKDMLDKLLALAKVEHRTALEDVESIGLRALAETVIADQALHAQQRGIVCNNQIPPMPKCKVKSSCCVRR